MNLYISHMSALRYWRQAEGLGSSIETRARSLRQSIASVKEARVLMPKELGLIMSRDSPLDILVGSKGARRYANELRPHVWPGQIPHYAFRQIDKHIYVSTPEFVYVQLAMSLSIVELAQLGNELCGGYYLLAHSGFAEHYGLIPITKRKSLTAFVEEVLDVRGAKKAQRALRWVANHCNSPMETNSLLALCLPRRMDGWSLRMPEVNKSIKVGKRMERYVGGPMYTPDFLWIRTVDGRIIRIVGEYDSHEHHDEESDAEHTRIRRNDMKTMGYLVTSINKSQMASAEKFQFPARQIARDLGVYRPMPDMETLRKQNGLLRLLRQERFR